MDMKTARESYNTRDHLSHVEKEQVDIRADIKIIQHNIAAIQDNMGTKTDIVLLKTEIVGIRSELKTEISNLKSELKTDISELKSITLKWVISLFIGGLTINLAVLGIIVTFLVKS